MGKWKEWEASTYLLVWVYVNGGKRKEKGDKLDGADRGVPTWAFGRALRPKQRGYFHRGILGPCYSKCGTGTHSIRLSEKQIDPPKASWMAICILTRSQVIYRHIEVWKVLPFKLGYLSTSQRVRKSNFSPVCPEHCPGWDTKYRRGPAGALHSMEGGVAVRAQALSDVLDSGSQWKGLRESVQGFFWEQVWDMLRGPKNDIEVWRKGGGSCITQRPSLCYYCQQGHFIVVGWKGLGKTGGMCS